MQTVPAFAAHIGMTCLRETTCCFFITGSFAAEDPEIQAAWQSAYEKTADGETECCLITGQETVPELVHPAIKNVRDAQSSGAALVSFNAPAFCSYGKEQNANAPVSKYAAFAYTSALNHLAGRSGACEGDRQYHRCLLGKGARRSVSGCFRRAVRRSSNDRVSDTDLNALMTSIAAGSPMITTACRCPRRTTSTFSASLRTRRACPCASSTAAALVRSSGI